MACCTDDELAEIEALKVDLAAVRTALRAILSGAQSYTLDTSQTRQTVTRADIGSLRLMRNDLTNELRTLENKCNGGGAFVARPGF